MGDPTTPRGPIFLAAIRGAFGRPPIWILCWLVGLLLALTAAAPWVGWFDDTLAHRYEPGHEVSTTDEAGEETTAWVAGEVLASLSENFRQDHRGELSDLRGDTARTTAVLALVAMLFGMFSAGGWLQIFLERTDGHSVRRFLWGGSRYFWRFFRLWILSFVLLAAVSFLLYGWPWKTVIAGFLFGAPDGETEGYASEWSAVALGWFQSGLYTLLFALVLTWGDYTRTRLALHDARSALWAGLCTLGLFLRHPIQALRPMALLLLVEWLVLWGAGRISWGLSSAGADDWGGWRTLIAVAVVGQLALLWRAITRGARYHAAVRVSGELVPPLSKPDPWAHRVGGPGGPQYPIDTGSGDEYGVSM